jgi:amino acid adenylation domain-containing protein
LWFLDRLTPGTGTYNIPSPLRLRGPVEPKVLAAALSLLVRRHETLRTRFAAPDGVPVQIVDPPLPVTLPSVDLSALPETLRQEVAARLTGEETARPFDLGHGPLLRALLLRLAPDEHGLVLTVHHIVSDGWSVRILLSELTELYRAIASGRPEPFPPLPLQYRAYARWQRERLSGREIQRQIAYWRQRLAGAPPALDLPLDRPRPAVQTYHGQSALTLLDPRLVDDLRRLGLSERASLFMTLLAVWKVLMARLAGQDDVLVGTPVAGRMRTEAESLIGCFLNTLVLRTDLSGNPGVRGLLRRVRETAVGAFAHQEIPFERLLEEIQPERDLSRTPLFQVFFNLANFPEVAGELPGGVTVEPLWGVEAESKFDMTVYATESRSGVYLSLVFNADLFDVVRMEELLRQYRGLLVQAAESPEAPLAALSLLTPEAARVLPDPAAPLSDEWVGAVHELLREQARARPDKVALFDAAGDWTYRALDEASDRIAAYLLAFGIGKEDCVAVWAHRSALLPVALFGILKAGAAFTILDPAYPAARLAEIVRLARPRGFLALSRAGDVPPEVEEALAGIGPACRLTLPTDLAILPPGRVEVEVGPDDLALLAFTSGSTGSPKGILGLHGSLSHFLPWLAGRFELSEGDRHTMLSGLAHDPLQRDIFTSLCLGAALAIPAPEDIASPGRVASWMARQGITFANLTPAMAQLATEAPGGGEELATVPSLRWLMLIGDVLTRRDVERLRRLAPQATCVNLYGATETQRALSYHVVGDEVSRIVPLGVGMKDCQLLVLDASGRTAGIGEVGEIAVRSPHLARGYLDDEAGTREKFVANPATGQSGDRLYRTGDLGRYLPDGQVTFAGRLDGQVKLRGFRIELGEIEAVLGSLPGVREAVAVVRDDRPERSLVAYLVLDAGVEIAALRRALRARLPAYMVPAAIVALDRLPLLPNGKVDRSALPTPQGEARVHLPPATETERTLAGIWASLLSGREIGRDDDFFALGGHSLLATRVLARVRDAFGVELPVATVFAEPTLLGLALAIDRARGESAAPALPKLLPRRRASLASRVAQLSDAEVAEQLRQQRGEERPDA